MTCIPIANASTINAARGEPLTPSIHIEVIHSLLPTTDNISWAFIAQSYVIMESLLPTKQKWSVYYKSAQSKNNLNLPLAAFSCWFIVFAITPVSHIVFFAVTMPLVCPQVIFFPLIIQYRVVKWQHFSVECWLLVIFYPRFWYLMVCVKYRVNLIVFRLFQ